MKLITKKAKCIIVPLYGSDTKLAAIPLSKETKRIFSEGKQLANQGASYGSYRLSYRGGIDLYLLADESKDKMYFDVWNEISNPDFMYLEGGYKEALLFVKENTLSDECPPNSMTVSEKGFFLEIHPNKESLSAFCSIPFEAVV